MAETVPIVRLSQIQMYSQTWLVGSAFARLWHFWPLSLATKTCALWSVILLVWNWMVLGWETLSLSKFARLRWFMLAWRRPFNVQQACENAGLDFCHLFWTSCTPNFCFLPTASADLVMFSDSILFLYLSMLGGFSRGGLFAGTYNLPTTASHIICQLLYAGRYIYNICNLTPRPFCSCRELSFGLVSAAWCFAAASSFFRGMKSCWYWLFWKARFTRWEHA